MLLTFLQRLPWVRSRWWAPHAMVKKYRCRVRPLACRRRTDERRTIMEAKPRLILALLMSSVMVCMVTLLVTFLDLGLRFHRVADRGDHRVLHHAAGAPPDRSHRRPDRRQAPTLRVLGVFPQLRCSRRRWREPRPRDRQGSGLRSWSATYYSTSPAGLFRSPRLEY